MTHSSASAHEQGPPRLLSPLFPPLCETRCIVVVRRAVYPCSRIHILAQHPTAVLAASMFIPFLFFLALYWGSSGGRCNPGAPLIIHGLRWRGRRDKALLCQPRTTSWMGRTSYAVCCAQLLCFAWCLGGVIGVRLQFVCRGCEVSRSSRGDINEHCMSYNMNSHCS
jgi:hypothetical protein